MTAQDPFPTPPHSPTSSAEGETTAQAPESDVVPGRWWPAPGTEPTLPDEGRYRLGPEIARGGMGVIYRAFDPVLGRDLAVKVLRPECARRPDLVRRFLHEAEVGAQLQHPGVVPVHEVGRLPDGRPYIAMKLVQGRTLAALLHERPGRAGSRQRPENATSVGADLPRFLRVFEQVCQTMAYAHARGVIHRDLKPLNVMVGEFGEVQVMDWGLAKRLRPGAAASPTETAVGTVLGTWVYMAPEQVRGEVERLDERTDVFGLGAILCEILTGRPPYIDLHQARAADLTGAVARLESCSARRELVRLARACLAADQEQRPRDARAVAQAVADYLMGG
jgi:serine/threonine-protein kinase